jgi:hypothetical protein
LRDLQIGAIVCQGATLPVRLRAILPEDQTFKKVLRRPCPVRHRIFLPDRNFFYLVRSSGRMPEALFLPEKMRDHFP